MATQPQKNQFIALAAIGLDPSELDKDRFQAFLKDPEMWVRFGEFINTYERRTYPSILFASLPKPKFPDWSDRILKKGVRTPQSIDFLAVMASPYFHPRQTGDEHKENRPSGQEILAKLVSSYKIGEDRSGNTYDVSDSDAIHGHFGFAELAYMEQNWAELPEPFKAWAKGKLLCGWRDVVRGSDGYIRVPCLNCGIVKPCMNWDHIGCAWSDYEPGLCG